MCASRGFSVQVEPILLGGALANQIVAIPRELPRLLEIRIERLPLSESVHLGAELSDDTSIDRVVLGLLARRLGEGSNPVRLSDHHANPGCMEARGYEPFVAARGLHHDARDLLSGEPLRELVQRGRRSRDASANSGHIGIAPELEFLLANVDPDDQPISVHAVPRYGSGVGSSASAHACEYELSSNNCSGSSGAKQHGGLTPLRFRENRRG
jgi:hypothetical protein